MTRKLTAFFFAISLLFTLNSIAQVGPDIIWQKSLGGSGDDKANDIIALPDGGFMVAGTTKSDNGDVSGHHGSLDSMDAWVCRLDATGSIIWQKSFGGSGDDYFSTIIRTTDGNFLLVGGSASFNGDVQGNHGFSDFWALKIDAAGSILWSKCFGGTKQEALRTGISTSEGGYLLIGNTFSNDGDVSGNHGGNGTDIWIAKINNAGNLTWQKCYGNTNGAQEFASDVIEDFDHHFIAIVHPNGDSLIAVNGNDEVQIKVNKDNGNLIYQKNGGAGSRFSNNGSLIKTPNGFIQAVSRAINYPLCAVQNSLVKVYSNNNSGSLPLLTPSSCPGGVASFTSIFARAHGLAALGDSSFVGAGSMSDNGSGPNGSYGSTDAFIGLGRFVLNGSVYSSKKFGGSGQDQFTSIKVLSTGNEYIVAGFSNSNNNDVSGNHGDFDFWIVKVAATNKIVGDVFIDDNNNGVKDGSEIPFNNAIITTSKPGFSKSGIPYGGHYQNDVDTGTFQTSLALSKPYYTVSPASKTTLFSAFKLTDTIHFALHPIPGKRDYSVVPVSIGMPRPGFTIGYSIQIINNGSDVLTNKTLSFIKDKRSRFISPLPAQSSISGDTITLNINNLLPQQNGFVSVNLKLDSMPSLQLNDTLTTRVYLDSTGDIVPTDNSSLIRQIIRGSYDPNDKQENHGGFLSQSEYDSDQYLTYRINFQNTGNDTAFNIYVRDTLDLKTHTGNIEMISSSHPYKLNVEKNNILVWSFENINLVDSIQNEPLSHGYLIFRVKPTSDLQLGDNIKNRASIYFDYNPPVLTNMVSTVIMQLGPEAPLVFGIKNQYCSTDSIQTGKLLNPSGNTTGTIVSVKLDTTNLQIRPDGSFNFDVSMLNEGGHQITATYSNATATTSSSIHLTTYTTITPSVELGSNITEITDMTAQVTITAVNVVGGGNTPLYTFARDRNMVNITQAEGISNYTTFNPSTLAIGENWIYVRMKTNSVCYSKQYDYDSIKLNRSTVTGIIDPDLPGKQIQVYPNPVSTELTINGLSPLKTYQVRLFNQNGSLVKDFSIKGKSRTEISFGMISPGNYILSLYDNKKQKKLGSMKILKR